MKHQQLTEELRELIVLYALGSLPPERATAFEDHLAERCKTCAREVRGLISVVGTLGYVFSGRQVPDLPTLALGFVYGPALLGIVAGSVLTAPVGARAAHRMPVATLRRIFAGLLYALATKMLWTYL